MSICGKGDLPGCRFFTTGGCVSPFNCIYKIEPDFHTGATSNATEISRNTEIARLTAENAELRATLSKMETVEKELRARLKKAIELPSGDRVWYIAEDEEGQEYYIIPKPTSSLTVEELKYEMDKKYFPTREAAEARLEEIKENAQLRERLEKAVELPRIVHPNAIEWFVQYQNKYGLIFDEIFYSERAAEVRLKELRGGEK